MASIPSHGLLLPLFVAPQIILAAVGMWLFDDLGRRSAEAIRTSAAGLEATAGLQQSLFDAERMALFAVIDGERLHPDVRKAFRMCIDQARARLPGAQAPAALPAQLPEAAMLPKRVDELARRGEALLAAPAAERRARYNDPEAGFQTACTDAWRDLATVRATHEVALQEAEGANKTAASRACQILGGIAALSVLLTVVMAWRLLRIRRDPATFAPSAPMAAEPVVAADGGSQPP